MYRRRRRYIRDLISRGRVRRRTERALHNDHDHACDHWRADRWPDVDDADNRNLDGAALRLDDWRCLVCRPYAEEEETALLGCAETQPAHTSLVWNRD